MRLKKCMERIFCNENVNAILLFLVGMAIITVIARMADSFMVPQVVVGASQEMSLQYPMEIEGQIRAKGKQAVYCRENLRVAQVMVEEGDTVKKGDVLFEIDKESLQEQIRQIKQEIQKGSLQMEDLEQAYHKQTAQQSQDYSRAKEDYQDAQKLAERTVDAAYQEMEAARQELAQHDGAKPGENWELGNREAKRPELGNSAKLDGGQEPDGSQEPENSIEPGEGQELVEETPAATWQQRREELAQQYAQKQKLYEEALASKEASLKAAARQVEDCSKEVSKDNAEALLQMDQDKLLDSLSGLEEIEQADGKIYASLDGRVSECLLSTGSLTSTEPALVFEDFSQPLQFEGVISQSAHSQVEEGIECSLKIKGRPVPIEGLKVSKVTAEDPEQGTYRVTAEIPSDSLRQTGEATLSFTRESACYPDCIPVSALYTGAAGNYIIGIKEDITILGVQSVAELIPVTPIEDNGEYVAVKEHLSAHGPIIINASKSIKEGDRVRIAEE